MELADTIAFVRRYNAWRRNDNDSYMPHPKDIGQALDALCDHAERLQRERNDARAEVALWKKRIVPFLAVHAGNYGKDHYGENCLHFTHYDMLAEAGGRMDDFKRCGEEKHK